MAVRVDDTGTSVDTGNSLELRKLGIQRELRLYEEKRAHELAMEEEKRKTLEVQANDITGTRVVPDPVVTMNPTVENNTKLLEDQYPGLFPACVVTRSMSLREEQNTSVDPVPNIVDTSGAVCDVNDFGIRTYMCRKTILLMIILADPSSKVLHLSQLQVENVTSMLQEYKHLFGDVPRACNLLEHQRQPLSSKHPSGKALPRGKF
ncbi:hypothetical protein Hamer_G013648 [Homarus americanus]|uniref:Uncharacterized protein n=1 Tax=Homarus americanus TaxID=6706 RepID=A0A8J5MW40_HOMAM|nr:hypothetical protein Hamer_G013648 [Homarus americanus]